MRKILVYLSNYKQGIMLPLITSHRKDIIKRIKSVQFKIKQGAHAKIREHLIQGTQ